MPLLRRCLDCGELSPETRCPDCRRAFDRTRRPGTTERGYGADHRAARAALEATLPGPCGYCGRSLTADDRWVAAHILDGDPSAGWMLACGICNERAKARGAT